MSTAPTTPIVLVPGFWLGGWAWDEVAAALRADGHEVTALTLPGLESADVDRSTVTLESHIAAICAAVGAAGPPVVLAVHSGAGFPGYAATDRIPDQIAAVVYVDTGPGMGAMDPDFDAVDKPLPPIDELRQEENLDGLRDEQLETFRSRAVPQPGGVIREAVELTNDARLDIPSTAICTGYTSEEYRDAVKAGYGFVRGFAELRNVTWVDLPTSHWPMWSRPKELADIIGAVARQGSVRELRPGVWRWESPSMEMLKGEQIAEANMTDWRKLAQGLHARYLVDDFGAGARFVAAVGEAGDALGHHPRVSIGDGYVDFKLVSEDAIYRDGEGTEHVVEWVTQQDVDLARRITEIAADHKVDADPVSVGDIELGLDTARSATIAPVWAALLTGSAEAQGRGSISDEIRDATGRVPNLWFGDADEHGTPRQRFHIEVYVAPEVAEQRIAAALAAGGTIVDDSNAPSLTVIADQDGNEGIVCVDVSAAKKD